VLIEDWLPVVELGIESRREAAPIPGQFPKLKTLHVWWARRPLAASAGAVLGSVMPAWSQELAAAFPGEPELVT
jgi:adenine-specific DNA methylase